MESRPYGLIGVDDFVRITLPFFRADKKLFYERLEHSVATLDRGGGGVQNEQFSDDSVSIRAEPGTSKNSLLIWERSQKL